MIFVYLYLMNRQHLLEAGETFQFSGHRLLNEFLLQMSQVVPVLLERLGTLMLHLQLSGEETRTFTKMHVFYL